ncbi:hypothetical protein [Vibrio thalassae]|uniref:hypothetical protein n=1 Tax=Vibrio thalassae TaxID=1243014 RepID=UPI0013052E9C|nr:hypothetical protein [Vibrio thalassae]
MAIRIGSSLKSLPFRHYSPSYSPPQQINALGNAEPLLDWYALAICYCATHRAHPYHSLDITQYQAGNMLTFFSHCRASYQRYYYSHFDGVSERKAKFVSYHILDGPLKPITHI